MEIKNKIIRYSLIIWAFCLIEFLSASSLWAKNYYVTDGGAGMKTGDDCANAISLSTFNTSAIAGDTAILCNDTYTDAYALVPTNSGTSGNPITYIADNQYGAEIVVTSGYGPAYLTGQDYITYDGLYFKESGGRWIYLTGKSDYLVVQNCKFYDSDAFSGIRLQANSDYGRIIDNIFLDAPVQSGGEASCYTPPYNCNGDCDDNTASAPADVIQFFANGDCDYWVIEGNTFGDSGHSSVYVYTSDTSSQYGVLRNNTTTNGQHHGFNTGPNWLAEGNIIVEGGTRKTYNPNERDRCNIDAAAAYMANGNTGRTIWRYNTLINNDYGLYFGSGIDSSTDQHYIYHNTLYNNWWAVVRSNAGHNTPCYFKNNLIYSDGGIASHTLVNPLSGEAMTRKIFRDYEDGDHTPSTNYYINNMWTPSDDTFYVKDQRDTAKSLSTVISQYSSEWASSNFTGTPNFVSPQNDETADLSLQSDSSAIDAAAELTLTTNTGAGATAVVTVADSRYFYDGWSIPGETADYIYIEDTGKVQILSVDSNTQITLTANAIWGTGKKIYHCPDGSCFSGGAPDVGANEYGGTPDIEADEDQSTTNTPKSLRIKN